MPEVHASFRPHERSLSWGQLAWNVATTPLYYVSEVFKLPTQLGWDLDNVRPPTTTAGLVQALDDIYDQIVDALRHTEIPAAISPRTRKVRVKFCRIVRIKVSRAHPLRDQPQDHSLPIDEREK